jgi:hypothetical protein
MAEKNTDEWRVLEHGPLEKLASNVWRVEGAIPGMSLRRVMVVARRASGSLVVHNAIALDERTRAQLEALGPLEFLVVPSNIHRLDAPAYKKRYPQLRVFAPSGSRTKVEERVTVDGVYEDFPNDAAVELGPLAGVADVEGVMTVRSEDGVSVVLNDAVFNMDKKKDFLGWFFTTVLGSAPGPRVSRLAKLTLVKDQKALKADLLRLSELPELTRLVVSHEKVASGADAASALRTAASYLR